MNDYTLTLTHNGSGWDGTHEMMLNVMAEILEDGPVDALLVYLDKSGRYSAEAVGQWVGRNPREGITFKTTEGATLRVLTENIESLSI